MRDAAARRYRDLADRANAKLVQLEERVDRYAGTNSSSSMGDSASTTGFPQA
jgi:hypothetical protein